MSYYGAMPAVPAMSGYDPAGLLSPMGAVGGVGVATVAPTAPAVPPEVLRHQVAAVLQHCYRWLEAAVPVVPQTAELVPVLVTAVHQYEAQQYDASLSQALAVVQAARQLRQVVPSLPPL